MLGRVVCSRQCHNLSTCGSRSGQWAIERRRFPRDVANGGARAHFATNHLPGPGDGRQFSFASGLGVGLQEGPGLRRGVAAWNGCATSAAELENGRP